jgi:large subunit ribosomal protein L21
MLGGKVEATIESISQGEKVIVFKKKRRKQYKKSFGFRAQLTSVRIENILCEITK